MITERAYLPYYYKTKVNNLDAILTKGTWEVQNDFMAGPYVNYIIKDTVNKRNIVNLLGTEIFLKEYVGNLLINNIEINTNKIGTKYE